MLLKQTVPPATLAVSLADAKAHLRIDTTDEDALIESMISTATRMAEAYTQRQIVSATFVATWPEPPTGETLRLPITPLISVTSVTVDGDAFTDFTAVSDDTKAYLESDEWPREGEVVVTYVAGYTSTPPAFDAAIKMLVSGMFQHREAVTDAKLEMNHATMWILDTVGVPKVV